MNLRSSILNPAPLLRDRQLGIDTALSSDLHELRIRGGNESHGNIYHPSSWVSAHRLLNAISIPHEQFQFVDVGCGKGLVLLAAAEYPFLRVLGVEFAAELCAIAERNVAMYRGTRRCAALQIAWADAVEFSYDPIPSVFYLYNPFDDAMLARFAARLQESLAIVPRPIVLLYNGRGRHDLLDALPGFERDSIDASHVVYRYRVPMNRDETSGREKIHA